MGREEEGRGEEREREKRGEEKVVEEGYERDAS